MAPKGAAYREEGTRLFAMSSDVPRCSDGFAAQQEAFNPTEPTSEIQGFTFANKGTHSVFAACEGSFRIEIKHGTRFQDVDQLLGAVMSQLNAAVPAFGERTIKIGEKDHDGNSIAAYIVEEKTAYFYAGEKGELLVNAQISELLAPGQEISGAQFEDFLQIAVAHEFGHALQEKYHDAITALAKDLKGIRDAGFSETPNPKLTALVNASSTDYLRRIQELWQHNAGCTDFEFAAEIWADVFAQSRLKRFDAKSAINADWLSLTLVVSAAASLAANLDEEPPSESNKEKLRNLEGRIHRLHHRKIPYPMHGDRQV